MPTIFIFPSNQRYLTSFTQVTQLKKSYPFGTAIGCDLYHHGDKRYADFIHAHFNWATTENALKWKLMEKKKVCLFQRRENCT